MRLRSLAHPFLLAALVGTGLLFAVPATASASLNAPKLGGSGGPAKTLFTDGNAVYVDGTVASAGRHWRFVVKGPNGTVRNTPFCQGPSLAANTPVDSTFTVLPEHPVSTASPWTYELEQFADATACAAGTGALATSTQSFRVVRAGAFANSNLTGPAGIFSSSTPPLYVQVAGLSPNVTSWSVEWILPSGAVACANTSGTNRPASTATGVLPENSGLEYVPSTTTGNNHWNRQSNYTSTCPAFDGSSGAGNNEGPWQLRLTHGTTGEVITTHAFMVATKAVSMASAPAYDSTGTINVGYSAAVPAPGTLARVELWVKEPGSASYALADTVNGSPPSSGSFAHAAPVDGTYEFYTRVEDGAGNYEDAPDSADATTRVDRVKPVSTASSPAFSGSVSIEVSYAAEDPDGSGVDEVELWVREPGETEYEHVATDETPETPSFDYTAAGSGTYRFYTRATDKAGNREDAPATPPDSTTVVDLAKPLSSATAPQYSNTGTVAVGYTVDDPGGSGIAEVELWARPPDGSWGLIETDTTPESPSFTYLAGIDGQHSFYTRARSVSGQYEDAPGSADASTLVDTVAPVTTHDVPADVRAAAVTVTLSATDSGSGVAATYYTTDDSDPSDPENPSRTLYSAGNEPKLEDGEAVRFHSVDNAGNAEAVKASPQAKVDPGSTFAGADGNQIDDGGATLPRPGSTETGVATNDWRSFALAGRVTTYADPDTADSGFAGGNKEQEPNKWSFTSTSGGVTPSKSNVQVAWSALESTRSTSYLYLGFKRAGTTGNSFLTFELNQNESTWVNSMGASVPCRTDGDILVSFSTGNPPTIRLFRWDGSGGPSSCPDGAIGTFSGGELVSLPNSMGAMNGSGSIANHLSPGTYGSIFPVNSFGEAAINLPAVLQSLTGNPCASFVQMQVHTRSSESISSALIDYVAPQPVFIQSCSVSGTKFEDQNGNGVRDADEPGLAGWRFYLDLNGNGAFDPGEPSAVSGSDGSYQIAGVPAGTYTLREAPTAAQAAAGWTCSKPATGCARQVTVAGNGGNSIRNDFGNWAPATVRGLKFQDLNRNGVRDAGEPPLQGVRLYVDYNGNGTRDPGEPYGDSAADGRYEITGIKPGTTRTVREELPQDGYVCTRPASTCAYEMSLASGEVVAGRDFGNAPTAKVSGTKFEDLDGDGERGEGEPGLSGWTVYVDYNGNSRHDPGEPSAVTGEDGRYEIDNVNPGTHSLRLAPDEDQQAAAWTCSRPSPCSYREVFTAGGALDELDFGSWRPALVSGRIFDDLDGDGLDTGEPGLEGWTVFVDYDNDGVRGSGEPQAQTGPGGTYEIAGVRPGGPYSVLPVIEDGWRCSSPAACAYTDLALGSGAVLAGQSFGATTSVTVAGTKFHDFNRDGVRGTGEPGLAGWTIYVDANDNGELDPGERFTTTRADGSYTITGIPAGEAFTVREVTQAGWACTFPAGCEYSESAMDPGDGRTGRDFGGFELGSVSGTIFEDRDANGERGSSEPGLAGWKVYSDDNENGVRDPGEPYAASGPDGSYTVQLVASGTLRVETPAGWACSYPAGACEQPYDSLVGGTHDFGAWRGASVSGTVYEDRNRDGERNPDEFGLGGVRVYIDLGGNGSYDAGSDPTALTDSTGAYTIEGVEPRVASYSVRQLVPAGYDCTAPAPCEQTATVLSGDEAEGVDFGNSAVATILGTKFEDRDADGARDPGDPPLEGWKVYVDYDGDGTHDPDEPSSVSGADGRYAIEDVLVGTWRVREEAPAGASDWTCSAPAGCGYEETFEPGTILSDRDFGSWQPAIITGTKFEDVNRSRTRDGGEPGLGEWRIYVDENGSGEYEAGEAYDLTQAGTGAYEIEGVTPGAQTLREELVGEYRCMAPADCSHEVEVVSGETLSAQDFGNALPAAFIQGTVFHDHDADGARGDDDEPLAGRSFYLDLDGDGERAGGEPEALTDANGVYTFHDVDPGTYTVRQLMPDGWRCSTGPAADGCAADVTVISGGDASADFGNYMPARVSGIVYEDLDADGARDGDDAGLGGWRVYVDLDGDGERGTGEPAAVSDASGEYAIEDVTPDGQIHAVRFEPTGAVEGDWACSQCSGSVELLSGADEAVELGAHTTGFVAGTVYRDLSDDGAREPGEPGLSGWTIGADPGTPGDDSDDLTATSGADGSYTISGLEAGVEYRVYEVEQDGWTCTEPAAGCEYSVSGRSRRTAGDRDFGNFRPLPATLTIEKRAAPRSAQVFRFEATGDGLENFELADDPDGAAPDARSFTLEEGYGTKVVRELPEAGWDITGIECTEHDGLEIDADRIELSLDPGDDVTCTFESTQRASVAGRVVEDVNGDGSAAGGEPGVADVVVFADLDGNGSHDGGEPAATSDSNGRWEIGGLRPGAVTIRQVTPAGWNCSHPAGCAHALTLEPGEDRDGRDFAAWRAASIKGTLYEDRNGNGRRDAGEPGLGGRTVYIDANGNGRRDGGEPSTTTGAAGRYSFTGLRPGARTVRQVLPATGWRCTAPSGCRHALTLSSGQAATERDFGSARVVVQQPPPPPLPAPNPPTVGDPTVAPADGDGGGERPLDRRRDPKTGRDQYTVPKTAECTPLRIDVPIDAEPGTVDEVVVVVETPSGERREVTLRDTPPQPADGIWSGIIPCAEDATLTLVVRGPGGVIGREFGDIVMVELEANARCVRRPVLAGVRGASIKRVAFFLDGRRIKTVKRPDRHGRFRVKISRAQFGDGTHVLVGKVRFKRGSARRRTTVRLQLRRCLVQRPPKVVKATPGPGRCARKAFLGWVRGDTIRRVEYSLNGRRLRNVTVADWKGRYGVTVDPAKLPRGKHRLTARVLFVSSTGLKPRTVKIDFRRC